MPETLDISPLILWVGALSVLLSFGTALWNVFSSPSRRNEVRIAELSKRIEGIELRSQRIEDRLGSIPTSDQLHALELSMTETRGELAVVIERLKPIIAGMDRLQEWMLENGK
jgi:hypothetical protein